MVKKEKEVHGWCCCPGTNRLFWGIFFLVIGGWFIAKDLGYVGLNISLWPVLLVIWGLWLILKGNKC